MKRQTAILFVLFGMAAAFLISPSVAGLIVNNATIGPDTPATDAMLVGSCNSTGIINTTDYYYRWYRNGTLQSSGKNNNSRLWGYAERSSATKVSGSGIYLNYSKPVRALTDSLWLYKIGLQADGSILYQNKSLPSDCWTMHADKVELLMNSSYYSTYFNARVFCRNATPNWHGVRQTNIYSGTATFGGCGGESLVTDDNWDTGSMYNKSCWVTSSGGNATAAVLYEDAFIWHTAQFENTKAYNVANISSGTTVKADTWILSCLASNSTHNSSWKNSSAVSIQNTPSTVASAEVNPSPATSLMNLTCNYTSTDLDNDTIIHEYYRWYRDGVLVNASNKTLLAGNTTGGDDWMCSVSVFDGNHNSSWTNSTQLTVDDLTPPSMTNDRLSATSGINDQAFIIYVDVSEANYLAYVKVEVADPNGIKTNYSMSPGTTSGTQSKTYTPGTDGTYTFAFYAADGSGNADKLANTLSYVETTSVGESGGTGGTTGSQTEYVEDIIGELLSGYAVFTYPGDTVKVKWLPVTAPYEKEVVITAISGDIAASILFSDSIRPYFSGKLCDLYTGQCDDTAIIKEGEKRYLRLTADLNSQEFLADFMPDSYAEGTVSVLTQAGAGPYTYEITFEKHYLHDTAKTLQEKLSGSGLDVSHRQAFQYAYAGLLIVATAGLLLFIRIFGIVL